MRTSAGFTAGRDDARKAPQTTATTSPSYGRVFARMTAPAAASIAYPGRGDLVKRRIPPIVRAPPHAAMAPPVYIWPQLGQKRQAAITAPSSAQ